MTLNPFNSSLFLILFLSLNAPAQSKKTLAEYWNETGIQLKTESARYLNNKNCKLHSSNFVGCIAFANTVLSAGEKKLMLLPTTLQQPGDQTLNTPATFGSLNILDTSKRTTEDVSKLTQAQIKQKNKESIDNRYKALASLHAKSDAIDFDSLREWLIQQPRKDTISESVIAADAINNYLSHAADPHTYIQPGELMRERTSPKQAPSLIGIGVLLNTTTDNRVIIENPIHGGPAHKAGIRSRDEITAVNGEAVSNFIKNVPQKILGAEGSTVELTIKRKNEVFNVKIVRKKVIHNNVESRIVGEGLRRVVVITVGSFIEGTCKDVLSSLYEAINGTEKFNGVALDLRNNPGGLLQEGLCISAVFSPINKLLASVRNLNGELENSYYNNAKATFYGIPMVVLINAGSASASEIVSGSLQGNEAAWIVGERSFGKGTVQAIGELASNNKVYLAKTIQRFFVPANPQGDERSNQIVGITPDINATFKPDATEDELVRNREEDMYANAVTHVGVKWKSSRPQRLAAMQSCVSRTGMAKDFHNNPRDLVFKPDYELLVAQDTIACDQHLKLSDRSKLEQPQRQKSYWEKAKEYLFVK